MTLVVCCTFALIVGGVPCDASSDGLLTQIPEQPAWAKYDLRSELTHSEPPNSYDANGTVTLKLLGSVTLESELCHWIEVEMNYDGPPSAISENGSRRRYTTVWKLLIKDAAFHSENGPCSGIVRGYFAHSSDPANLDPKEIHKLNSGAILEYLHSPFVMPAEIKSRRIATGRGDLECVGIELETLVGDDNPITTFYRQWTNSTSPFGTVEFEYDCRHTATAERIRQRLRLVDWGQSPTSNFPEAK